MYCMPNSVHKPLFHLKDLLRQLYQNLGADYFTDQAKLALDFDPNRYWREISIIPKQLRQGRLLDVGCATGAFCHLRSNKVLLK